MPPAAGWRLFVTRERASNSDQAWAPRLVERLSTLAESPFDRLCIGVYGGWVDKKATDEDATAAVNGALQRMAARGLSELRLQSMDDVEVEPAVLR